MEMGRRRRRNSEKSIPSGDFYVATPYLLIARRLSGDWRPVDGGAAYIREQAKLTGRRGHFGTFAAILQFAPIWLAAFHKIYAHR